MRFSPSFKKTIYYSLSKFFIILALFVITGCSQKKEPLLSRSLSPEEKLDLEYFFRSLIFENYGAFVLFGSKPMCLMQLSDEESTEAEIAFEKWYEGLPIEKKEKIEEMRKNAKKTKRVLERNPYRGWLALEKVMKNIPMKNFTFRLTPVCIPDAKQFIPGSYHLELINNQTTGLILTENYEIFKNAAGMNFQALEAVSALQDPDSVFWKNVFSMQNHLAKGLLFGFGIKNATFFQENLPFFSKDSVARKDFLSADTVNFSEGSPSNFTIPVFRAIPGDETVEKYRKEKAVIEKIYCGEDLVEVTLRRLAGC